MVPLVTMEVRRISERKLRQLIEDVNLFWRGMGCSRSCCIKYSDPNLNIKRVKVREQLSEYAEEDDWKELRDKYCDDFLMFLLNEPIQEVSGQ